MKKQLKNAQGWKEASDTIGQQILRRFVLCQNLWFIMDGAGFSKIGLISTTAIW
jgi:hypothetical protein